MDPANLKKWLIVLGIAYLLFPRDLLPDYVGRGLGLIDDGALIAYLTYFYRRRLREFAARAASGSGAGDRRHDGPGAAPQDAGPTRQQASERAGAGGRERAPSAHEVLGVRAAASPAEIRSAYKARMAEYHPDKVAHLGEELQQLAHRKVLEIQEAYRQLTR